ncbi:hypothetical protein [Streptomyces sp. NPDC057677]
MPLSNIVEPTVKLDAVRELHQELATSRVGLAGCHLPEQVDQLLLLIT